MKFLIQNSLNTYRISHSSMACLRFCLCTIISSSSTSVVLVWFFTIVVFRCKFSYFSLNRSTSYKNFSFSMSGLLSSSFNFSFRLNRSASDKDCGGVAYLTSEIGVKVSSFSTCFISRFLSGVDFTLIWGILSSTSLSFTIRRLVRPL